MNNFAKIFADNRASILERNNSRKDIVNLKSKIKRVEDSDLLKVKGIGDVAVVKLLEAGIGTQDELKKAGIDTIKTIIKNPITLIGIKKFLKQ